MVQKIPILPQIHFINTYSLIFKTGTTFKVKNELYSPNPKNVVRDTIPQFYTPHTKQRKNENWQTLPTPRFIINFTIHLTSLIDFIG